MNIGLSVSADLSTSMITGLFPGPPGAGKGHPFELRAGPFFGGELQVISLRGRERINDVYRYEVIFATEQAPELVTSALFGMPAALTLKSPGNSPRVIQGLAVSIEALGGVAGEQGSKRRRFGLTIVPRLWLLRRRRSTRIFQNKSVPEIVQAVLSRVGIQNSDCHWRADRASYPRLPFVYQRQESDYDFFRRVLASAGIFFFYEHASGILDGMLGGAASAAAGAVGAAAGMLGGATGSAVGTVESAAGLVPVLNFGAAATHTAAVAGALGGIAADALQAGLGALGGAAGAAVGAVAGAIEEPSDTLGFDDDMGADADVERVYEFELKKTLRTKELRMLDRDVEAARSWVGVGSVADASASLNLSAGLSLAGSLSGGGLSGGLSAVAQVGASFDVDAPTLPARMLRQEIYQEDLAVRQDPVPPGSPPSVNLSAGQTVAGIGIEEAVQASTAASAFNADAAVAKRLQMELERVRRKYQEAQGRSDCRRLGAGYRFTLGVHPITMVNGEYTVTALDVVGIHPDFLAKGQAVYRNRFRCIPSSMVARPKRPARRPKPGMEVARVVGFVGGETLPGLESNQAGYVRVRFRWDIVDDYATPRGSLEIGATETDDVHSVWLPVVQPWAGAGYGAQFIPREGMEVLVGFMEDQSERPVILGCLYSDANRPPWDGYIDHQKVGIRSQTRPFDHGYSEISIDDRQGGEVVKMRAQRNLDVEILRDSFAHVHRNVETTVDGDRHERVHQNLSSDVTVDSMSTVGGNRVSEVRGDSTLHVVGNKSTDVQGSETHSVQRDLSVAVSGRVETVTRDLHQERFEGDAVERHLGHKVVLVGNSTTKRSTVLHVEGAARAYASSRMDVVAEEGFTLTCGKSQIRVTSKGITFSSPKITLSGDTEIAANKVVLAAQDSLTLGGKKVAMTSSGASVTLDTNAAVQGSKVKLGGGDGASAQASTAKVPPTTLTLADQDGNPLADQRVVLRKGGDGGDERMVVLDAQGAIQIPGPDAFDVSWPDFPDAGKGAVQPPKKKPGDPKPLVIAQGDHLSKLAARHGFDEANVWKDPKNADIKKKRANPNMLVAGDILYVPENKPTWIKATIGSANAFVATVPRVPVRAQFMKDGKPMANEPYHLRGVRPKAGTPDPATTDADGCIHVEVPVTTSTFRVCFEGLGEVHTIQVGHLDPADEPSGARMRLGMLGLLGRHEGARLVQGPDAELPLALRAFQRANGLKTTGELDEVTVSKLKQLFGS